LKRIFDLTFSIIGLILLSPLFIHIALRIKLCDGGPIFYRQIRIGRNREKFEFIKFRSMITDADRKGALVTATDDDRITTIGHFIRRTKLDELPSLWNVLIGDMSLVGPRPEVPRYVQYYKPEWERVFSVRPGITDLATLQFRDEQRVLACAREKEKAYIEVVLPLKINLALDYVNKMTFWFDFKILFLTIWGITLGRFLVKPDDSLAEKAVTQIKSLNL